MGSDPTTRLATAADIPVLMPLMQAAITDLLSPVLTPEQVESSRMIMGIDTQLIADGTYFVIEIDGEINDLTFSHKRADLIAEIVKRSG